MLWQAALVLISRLLAFPASPQSSPPTPKQPVIVELFTSEGCSSCPPADALLKQLSEDQPLEGIEIIPLEEHVDYWNHQGWTDPFSSIDFSQRQGEYAGLPGSSVYTPQMVIDGHVQFVGSHAEQARQEVRSAAAHPKARLILSSQPSSVPRNRAFEIRLAPDSSPLPNSLDLYIAITEKSLRSSVTAGENSGATLQHSAVVRQFHKLRSTHLSLAAPVTYTVGLRKDWVTSNLTVVAFLTDRHHQVLAAGASPVL